jgi:hypothetical protein
MLNPQDKERMYMPHRSLSLKQRFGVCVMFASLFSGCASVHRQPYTPDALIKFEPDCSIREQQTKWLKSIMPTREEMQMARTDLTVFGSWSSDRQNKEFLADGNIGYFVKQDLLWIEQLCGN